MARLSDKAVFLIGSRVINTVFSFGTGLLLVRYLTKQEYGTYLQVILVGITLATVLQFGIPASIYYFFPKLSTSGRRPFLYQTLIMLLGLGLLGSIGIFVLRVQIGQWMNNPELTKLSLYLMGYLILLIIEQCSDPIFLSADRAQLAALIEVIFSISWITLIALPLLLHWGVTAVIGMILILYALKTTVLLFYAFLFSKRERKEKMFMSIPLAEQIQYFYPLGLSSLTVTISKGLDKFVIAYFLPPAIFAVYGRGAFELPLVGILPTTLSNLLLPRYIEHFDNKDSNSLINLWHIAIQKTALVILPVFVFALIMANPIITILYTENYADSVGIFRIYLFLLPLRMITYSTILIAIGQTKSVFKGTWIYLISSTVLCILFYRFWGMYGPAFGVIASETLLVGYLLSQIQKKLELSPRQVLPWRFLGKTLLVALIAGCAIVPVYLIPLPKFYIFLIAGLFYLPFFAVLAKKFSLINQEEIQFFKDWIKLHRLGLNTR